MNQPGRQSMKRTIFLAAAALLMAGSAFAQSDVDTAVLAAPERLRGEAMVVEWNPTDWSYSTLREGTNQVVCFHKSGLPGQLPFSVECTHTGNLDRAAQNMELEAVTDRAARQAALQTAEADGSRPEPVFGSIWWHFQGASQAEARRHHTIAVPGATSDSVGFPDNPNSGGVWLMDAGTTGAHLMIPGE
jgi:hypothetical protein